MQGCVILWYTQDKEDYEIQRQIITRLDSISFWYLMESYTGHLILFPNKLHEMPIIM
jgi:hypothetical protein